MVQTGSLSAAPNWGGMGLLWCCAPSYGLGAIQTLTTTRLYLNRTTAITITNITQFYQPPYQQPINRPISHRINRIPALRPLSVGY